MKLLLAFLGAVLLFIGFYFINLGLTTIEQGKEIAGVFFIVFGMWNSYNAGKAFVALVD